MPRGGSAGVGPRGTRSARVRDDGESGMVAARRHDVAPLPLAQHRDDVEGVEPLEHRAARVAHLAERLVGAGEMGVVHDVRGHRRAAAGTRA